jgi:uncharacterized membrane protein
MRYEAWLGEEVTAWVREGIVSDAQAEAIRRRYATEAVSRRRGRVTEALATVGAVVAGLGIVLFFAANWDGLPRPSRVLLLLGTVVGASLGGFWLRDVRGSRPRVGAALLLLGGIAFGASLFLVGQMYHVQAHDPLAFLALAAGTAATAWIARSQALAVLALTAGGAWLVYEAAVAGPGEDVDTIVYLPVVAAVYGAALYGFGTGLADRLGPFTAPARWLGATAGVLGAFVLTFRAVADELAHREPAGVWLGSALVVLGLAAVAGAVVLLLRSGRSTAVYEAAAVAATTVLVVLAVLVPGSESAGGGDPVLYPILFNVLVAALALGAVLVGYANDEQWLVTGGLAWIGIDLIARYLDFFWDLLPRSLVFVGVGAGILVLAYALERQRRGLFERMELR